MAGLNLTGVLQELITHPEVVTAKLSVILESLGNESTRNRLIDQGLLEIVRDICCADQCNLHVRYISLRILNHLVHDDMAIKQKLSRPQGLLKKLRDLCLPTNNNEKTSELVTCIQEETVNLIRKIVLCSDFHIEVATLDIIQYMINLAGVYVNGTETQNSDYTSQSTSYLHNLTHGKKLVGKVKEYTKEQSQEIIQKYLSAMDKTDFSSKKQPSFSVYSVELYDTTTDQDINISHELINEGVAWPHFPTPEDETMRFLQPKGREEQIWADVVVASVIDGGHFWAQIGGDSVYNKIREIKNILLNEAKDGLRSIPSVGEYYCVRTMVAGHTDVYRGKVLQVLEADSTTVVEVFAIDYGYTNVVAMNSLRMLPNELLIVPFQAQLCHLADIQPTPKRTLNVENATGALRSFSYKSNSCRIQIMEKGGLEVIIRLCSVPDQAICIQAVGTLLNLSTNFKCRARIGYLDGVNILLGVVQKYLNKDTKLVSLAVGALRNLMLDMPTNRGRVAENDGIIILTHVYFTCSDSNLQKECLGALKNLIGNAWYMLTGTGGIDFRSVVDSPEAKQFSLAFATKDISTTHKMRPRTGKKLRPGEVAPKPIEKSLAHHVIKSATSSSCEDSEKESGTSQDGVSYDSSGDDKLLIPSPRLTNKIGTGDNKNNTEFYYIRGEMVSFLEDELHELREATCAKYLSSAVIARPACAFLNAGKGGTVYLGVNKSRVVSGVEISRKDRDRLRLGIDELLGDFKPSVRYDKYQVNFIPVAEPTDGQRKSIQLLPNTFVIEVIFLKSSDVVYSTNKRRSYFRCGTSNTELSTQEIRKWVIREHEAVYNQEILSLKREITEMREKLHEKVSNES